MKVSGVNVKYTHTSGNEKNTLMISGNLDNIQWVTMKLDIDYKILVCIQICFNYLL